MVDHCKEGRKTFPKTTHKPLEGSRIGRKNPLKLAT